MKILVTGGTGFLGKRLVQTLVQKGHRVSVFSRHSQDDMPKGVKVHLGDVRKKEELRRAFEDADVVYHLAICLDESSRDMWDINVNGTKNIVELCKENDVKQLIYMSSSGVLGETKEPSREDFPYRPATRYEKSKMESEMMIKKSGVPYTIIRTTIIIGPNPIWLKLFEAAKKGFPLIGNGKNYFHLVYVEDVVRILSTVLQNKKAMNETFHVASPDTPTYEEVYKIMCDELKCSMTEKHIPVFVAYAMSNLHTTKRRLQGKKPSLTMMKSSIDRLIRNRILSTNKARNVLGFTPKYDTRTAIRDTIKYLKIARLGYSDYDLTDIHNIKSTARK